MSGPSGPAPWAALVGRLVLTAQQEADAIIAEASRQADRRISEAGDTLARTERLRDRIMHEIERSLLHIRVPPRFLPTTHSAMTQALLERSRSVHPTNGAQSALPLTLGPSSDAAPALVVHPPLSPVVEWSSRIGTSVEHESEATPSGTKGGTASANVLPEPPELPQMQDKRFATDRTDANRAVASNSAPRPVEPVLERQSVWAPRARNVGIFVVLFCLYQVWGTGLREARSQDQLAQAFEAVLTSTGEEAQQPLGPTESNSSVAPSRASDVPPQSVLGLMEIPKLGLEKAIVEGTDLSSLRHGPGHYKGTAMPGEFGNASIAGHRTTYGAPFRDLDELVPGDEIVVTTVVGRHRYLVSEMPRVIRPDQHEVLADHGDARLTLTTCNPEWRSSERLIVVAELVEPVTASPMADRRSSDAPVLSASLALAGETSAGAAVAAWAVVLAGLWFGYQWARQHLGMLVLVFVLPVGTVALANLFEGINRFLPGGI